MAEIKIGTLEHFSKKEKYKQAYNYITSLINDEADLIANMANTAALLKEMLNFFWIGFYINRDDELVLGPFQGSVACTRIALDKGVCGAAASMQKTIIVPNVNLFPGHISCSEKSKSEIVVPFVKENKTIFVLDVDSEFLNHFDKVDQQYLEMIIQLFT